MKSSYYGHIDCVNVLCTDPECKIDEIDGMCNNSFLSLQNIDVIVLTSSDVGNTALHYGIMKANLDCVKW